MHYFHKVLFFSNKLMLLWILWISGLRLSLQIYNSKFSINFPLGSHIVSDKAKKLSGQGSPYSLNNPLDQ